MLEGQADVRQKTTSVRRDAVAINLIYYFDPFDWRYTGQYIRQDGWHFSCKQELKQNRLRTVAHERIVATTHMVRAMLPAIPPATK